MLIVATKHQHYQIMLSNAKVFSSFSVKDIDQAERFYSESLKLNAQKTPEGLSLKLNSNHDVFIYPKDDHQPATFTVLNFIVDDLETTVDQLTEKGIQFEHYSWGDVRTDSKGIFRGEGGPRMIAWFKDPDGNFLSVLQQE